MLSRTHGQVKDYLLHNGDSQNWVWSILDDGVAFSHKVSLLCGMFYCGL
uniref:Uncharacterized protein n=1 Tax=Rhizophora mucronata TaxID=61149 RepID=A0A2P2PRV3_RHIMU